jgi:hypothetical protein
MAHATPQTETDRTTQQLQRIQGATEAARGIRDPGALARVADAVERAVGRELAMQERAA